MFRLEIFPVLMIPDPHLSRSAVTSVAQPKIGSIPPAKFFVRGTVLTTVKLDMIPCFKLFFNDINYIIIDTLEAIRLT